MGRPSKALLGGLQERIDELTVELVSARAERIAFAADVLAGARRSQVLMAAGHSPANLLDGLERRAIQEDTRARASRVEPEGGEAA